MPALLMPGRALSASLVVPVPPAPGECTVSLAARRCDRADADTAPGTLRLVVASEGTQPANDGCAAILDEAQAALVEASALRGLPSDYTDVTQGALAGLKRRIKRKLLGNFKTAYVDVLSRQQSACNEKLLAAVQALAECCATLDHAVRQLHERLAVSEPSPKRRRATDASAKRR